MTTRETLFDIYNFFPSSHDGSSVFVTIHYGRISETLKQYNNNNNNINNNKNHMQTDVTYQQQKKLQKAFAARSWWRRTEGKLQLASRTNRCHVLRQDWVTAIRFTSQLKLLRSRAHVSSARVFAFSSCNAGHGMTAGGFKVFQEW